MEWMRTPHTHCAKPVSPRIVPTSVKHISSASHRRDVDLACAKTATKTYKNVASSGLQNPALIDVTSEITHQSLWFRDIGRIWVVLFCALCLMPCFAVASSSPKTSPGLPFVRTYSLSEIGASRGAKFSVDRIGRIAVISNQDYTILNDNTWIHPLIKVPDLPQLLDMRWDDVHKRYFYGSLGSWGTLQLSAGGQFEIRSLIQDKFPKWVMATNFEQTLLLGPKVIFAGYNGIVIEDIEHGTQKFLEVPELVRVFTIGSRVFLSSHSGGMMQLDMDTLELVTINKYFVAKKVVPLNESEVLISTTGERLLVFNGKDFRPWPCPFITPSPQAISCIAALPDGSIAIAIDEKGVFILSNDGDLQIALTTPDYQRVFDLLATENGILWIATETMVQKVFCRGGISIVDQRSNMIARWPHVVTWHGKVDIASHGRLYEMVQSDDGLSFRFESLRQQPLAGIWGVDSANGRMLVGNRLGVYARNEYGFEPVLSGLDAARLVMTEDDYCFVIGNNAIGLLHWDGKAWTECAPRIPGVGFPSIFHYNGKSLWIELGLNLAARIWIADGTLHSRLFDSFPWTRPSWVNIGCLGDIVVMSGPGRERVYFSEETGTFVEAPEIRKLLDAAPAPIQRIVQDSSGIIWATYENGVLTIDPKKSDQWERPVFGKLMDRYPMIDRIDKDEVWVSTNSALYHIDRNAIVRESTLIQPMLLSILDGRNEECLYSTGQTLAPPEYVPYSKNRLIFQFFAGSYSSLQTLSYKFTIKNNSEKWSIFSADSTLTLSNLWEGSYELSAQLLEGGSPIGNPTKVCFTVEPPWFRTAAAYVAYGLLLILGAMMFRAMAIRSATRKHLQLEDLVRKRTEELGMMMDKLTAEVRTSATLAERDRLAGEMHDSVQQGLSGLILSLDATLMLSELSQGVRNRLEITRRMVSVTRQEVQQAIWDLESPLLKQVDLADALRSMCQQFGSGTPKIELNVHGLAVPLLSSIEHNLLRIAQESITNAIRHSQSDRIIVNLSFSPAEVTLEIRDFGKGFIPNNVVIDVPGHFGLRGMRARAAKINARIAVTSETGKGTTVKVNLSLPPSAADTTNR